VFATLQDRLAATFKDLRGKGRLSDADIDATCREIRIALLEADVALPVVKDFIAAIKERARGAEVSAALNPAQQVVKIVNEELVKILGGETRRLRFAKTPPTVILLAGLQGTGKTTLAGKLARWLREQGSSPLLVAADLQRPNAVTQLEVVAGQAGVAVYAPEPGNGVGDPVDVARRGVAEARRRLHDVVLIDTAGRLGIDADLMAQAADIRDAVRPDETLFVVDAMIGQDAVTTARAFLDGVGFDGVVLTKLDGDARGGAALSVAQVTGRQVMFASNGEKMSDFDVFHPDRMASRILGMGDMLTLIEQAEKAFDVDQASRAAAKLTGQEGDFTLDDFLEQMQAVRKMGSMSKIFGMLPWNGAVPRPDRQHRRARDRQDPGDHHLDDTGRAGQSQDPRRVAPLAGRPRIRHDRARGRRSRGALLRGPQDDVCARERARRTRHARNGQAHEGTSAGEEGQAEAGVRQSRQASPGGGGRRRASLPARRAGGGPGGVRRAGRCIDTTGADGPRAAAVDPRPAAAEALSGSG
jgi:signal recognition particle subunit SRP54